MKASQHIACILTLVTLFAAGCSSPVREESREPRIRYLNLRTLFDYLAGDDAEVKSLRGRREELRRIIDDLEGRLRPGGGIPEAVLRSDIRKYEGELKETARAEERLRGKYYDSINRAVTSVARRIHVDYVFNIGDDLVYSRRENDITELVLQELSGMKKRSAPQSR